MRSLHASLRAAAPSASPSIPSRPGAAGRTEAGKDCPFVEVLYDGKRVVFGPLALLTKQLKIGATDLQLQINANDAEAAGIPACILKPTGFERNVIALDEHDDRVELATFGTDSEGDKTVAHCSAEELASVVKLVFKLSGKGASEEDQQAALQLFSITIASAPVAAK